jgi:hypothetical protein
MIPTECGVFECDRETSTMMSSLPLKKKINLSFLLSVVGIGTAGLGEVALGPAVTEIKLM